MNKRLAGTGLAIGLVAGAGAGLILEMSGSVGAASGNSVAVSAAVSDLNTDEADTADSARPDPTTRLQEVLQPLVDDGTITQEQADTVIAALAAARPFGGIGGGHHGPGGRVFIGLDVVATTLGVTADEVRTALHDGQSIADLAGSNGKTAQDVIDAIVADATTRINAKVTAGDLTQADADQHLADLTTRVTEFVNSTPPIGGPGFGGRGGPGHHGDDIDADDDAPVDTTATTDTGS
jgi:hypothetical protein